MTNDEIPLEYRGWWQIIETSQWVDDRLDLLGTALISLTGYDDRLRMFALLADVRCWPTEDGVSFTWQGSWEYDPVSGIGWVKLLENGRLSGWLEIQDGDESTFVATRADPPAKPIPDLPSYHDKWRRRW